MEQDPKGAERTLVVLADGAQAAFAAAAVSALAAADLRWPCAYGAGVGAQIAALAVLGEARECRRRWEREAELGCPLLLSRLDAARQRRPVERGIEVAPDAWTIPGWLDDASLERHLAPELSGLPERLSRAGARSYVAVQDLTAGRADWFDLAGELPEEAGDLLRATASFCGGWGPMPGGDSGARCGGVAAALHLLGGRITGGKAIDLVCGFPVPAVRRPQVVSVFELVQRQDELAAALAVAEWRHRDRRKIRIVAPEQASWEAWAERDGADLGLEYPLPWDSNGELMGLVLRYGDFVGRRE